MEKTTHELKLPDSGAVVVFYDHLTIGDVRKIRRAVADTMRIKVSGQDAEIEPISGSIGMEQEELVLECCVKEIMNNGQLVTDIKDFIYNLSVADGDLVYAEVNRISTSAELNPDAKKK